TTVSSRKSHATGILLANHASGRTRYDTNVQRLSSTSSRAEKPSAAINLDYGSVAVPQIGN
ncbi:hypothetical protein Tco_0498153, partial [Tanacetum coccineum]